VIYPVYEWPSKRLVKKASLVDLDNATKLQDATDTVNNLFETMHHHNGIGLAATQCGIGKSIFVMDTTSIHEEGVQQSFVNPVIVDVRGETTHQEGCLSFPGVYANIDRHEMINVVYWDVDVERIVEQQFTGIESICFQHELDHLNGIVFVDYLSTLKRSMVLKKLKKRSKV